MKKFIVIVIVILCGNNLKAQGVDMFQEKEILWLGVDFTGAKMIGSSYFLDPQMIKTQMFDTWNQLIVKEEGKFNIKEFYVKRTRYNDLLPVKKRNGMVDFEKLVIDDSYTLSKKEVASICGTYTNLQKDSGLGVLYVVESFDKVRMKASVYVVFFDLSDSRPVYMKKYEGVPGGANMRNMWANAIFRIMERSGVDYRVDMKKYMRVKRI